MLVLIINKQKKFQNNMYDGKGGFYNIFKCISIQLGDFSHVNFCMK